ncbi:glycoside hydrolase family 3 N-terminal domain-containing protein [Lyngbya sp. PCC 8106]|uniref:glycoside hydrolase family 3 N-terminal domain-containing protein n=1 Tax=Lyngbya sp. (strain PCC 8106) TaxID=313612 RepID=UPI0000EA89ED|nr:glycoside hydrolase family 3 N-terminal domain-containing protein [Lyngbya sp. PCC 8106]EAW37181.1 beta-glucosidase [Lyngbya sp. PCC 8106]
MNLSLAEQVAQMVVVRASGYLFDHQIRYRAWEPPAAQLKHWLQDLGVGGVLLVDGSAVEIAVRTQQLQAWAKFPLLLAADIEEGVGQRFAGATWFPPPMALGSLASSQPQQAVEAAKQMGNITALEAQAIGLNWILAPVVDVNNNPDNPVINVRSFGETPATVSRLASAFIRGCQSYPVLTTAKHFPGHGDTAIDSHLELPTIPHSAQRLNELELIPFREAISTGVDAVMSAHLLIAAWDNQRPATLSRSILTGQLRQKLGFNGLIVTDALVMGAIANQYSPEEAPVLAVEAGADIILMPVDPEVAIRSVCDAVVSGRISPERIRSSVQRICSAKAKVYPGWNAQHPGLFPSEIEKHTFRDLSQRLSSAVAQATVSTVLQETLKMGGTIPVKQPSQTETPQLRNVVIVDDLLNCGFLGNHTPAIALPAEWGYQLQLIDSKNQPFQESLNSETSLTLLQIFLRGNPFRGSAGLTEVAEIMLKNLLKMSQLQALVIYGSPYALERFRSEIPSHLPYIFSFGQMPSAQVIALKTLFGM